MAGTSRKKSASLEKGGKKPGKHVSDEQLRKDSVLFHDIWIIVIFVLMLFLFFANFGIIGPFGNAISGLLFGIFGFSAYIAPLVIAFGIIFWGINAGNPTAVRKIISGGILFLMFSVVCDLLTSTSISMEHYSLLEMFRVCRDTRGGGGVIAGSLTYLLLNFLELFGTILVVLLCSVICLIFLTEKSFVALIKQRGYQIKEKSARNRELRRELRDESYEYEDEEYVSNRSKRQEARRLKEEEIENEKILRMKKKVSGVTIDTSLRKDNEKRRDDMHEITYEEEEAASSVSQNSTIDFNKVNIRTAHQVTLNEVDDDMPAPSASPNVIGQSTQETFRSNVQQPAARQPVVQQHTEVENEASVKIQDKPAVKKYMFPPLSRLNKGTHNLGDSEKELKETAIRLQNTLNTFGVNVTITDISQGPSVTRYELAPEQGVKVSKILSLSDDIKLNLAATDIRIEAPIPGKAAIGIEVPNKENMGVALRDLLESKEFVNFDSNLAFAVGKDISGQVVVGDIGKMPHMLIAGSTGSGKSVFINTLIMSILYKAHPDDVKLILVDPKVVELSVYNGIPHLLIPVVTDPKKASAALHWGVAEMEDRYKKFAEYNVRDLKGFNKMVESMRERGEEDAPSKIPQIVIVVDELADLMMVCAGEVEESICRLAQLVRAAGIHLIIATQRPSVDVITGLIKANMPSRVAFAVSSGTDSRVVLDMNGAEKLLGKGDMLYYPQGYTKPARIQGAFVSDKEVSDVVDFLKNQTLGNVYVEDIEQKISSMGSSSTGGSSDGSGSDRDELFAEAGRTIIDKDKASIGMLQRMFKIGFNRAARIMDQLCEYGVVGDEEGTKPRKVLMSMEQFEQLLEEI